MPPSSDWDTNYSVQSRRTFIDVEHEHADSGIKQMVATLSVFCTLLITLLSRTTVLHDNDRATNIVKVIVWWALLQRTFHRPSDTRFPTAKKSKLSCSKENFDLICITALWYQAQPVVPMQQAGPEKLHPKQWGESLVQSVEQPLVMLKNTSWNYFCIVFKIHFKYAEPATQDSSLFLCFTSNSSQTSPLNQYQPAVSDLPLFPLRCPYWGFQFTSVLKANILQNQF